MTVEARTGRPKSRWGGPDFRRTPYPTGTGKSWGAIGADHVIKPVPFGYFAHGLGDDQGTCCSPPDIALRIPRITARFFRNSLHHKGVVALAENGRVALSASPCLSVYPGEVHSGYTFAARSFQATPAPHNFLGVSRKPWLCPFRVPDPTI